MQTLIELGYTHGDTIEAVVAFAGVAICVVAVLLTKTETK